MKGKQRCKILTEIRRQIAENNDIEYVVSECKHQGDCLGTCPKCEAEVRYLERELERRRKLGMAVTVAGLAVMMTASTVSCNTADSGPSSSSSVESVESTDEVMVEKGEIAPPETDEVELGGAVEIPGEAVPNESEEIGIEGDITSPPENDQTEDSDKEFAGVPPYPYDDVFQATETDDDVELGGDPLPDDSNWYLTGDVAYPIEGEVVE